MKAKTDSGSGVYTLINKVTGSVYVGSTVNLRKRRIKHFTELRKKKHANLHLQRSFDKYGEMVFVFTVIKLCPIKEARIIEQIFLDSLWGKQSFLNVSRIVDKPNEGRKLSEVHKSRIGLANALSLKGNTPWNKGLVGVQQGAMAGKKHTEETKNKMSIAKMGKPAPWNSYKRSEKTCKKIRDSKRGVLNPKVAEFVKTMPRHPITGAYMRKEK